MKPVEFKGQNVVFGEGQPEYQPLPALLMPDGEVITCWEMSPEELQEVTKTGKVYVKQLTFNQLLQPLLVTSDLSGGIELKEV